MIKEYIAPGFIQDEDSKTIHNRMMESLPMDIDRTEGGFPYDLTMPSALEKSELVGYHLNETIKLMFPIWAYGEWLDLHAKTRGLERKPPNKGSGSVLVKGLPGTVIPGGFLFAVPATMSNPSVDFALVGGATIGAEGECTAEIMAVEAGVKGNVSAGSISMMVQPLAGILSGNNPEGITGGTPEETDDELRQRIAEVDEAAEALHVGSDSDYLRWAKEIPGVGTAIIVAEHSGPGTVKVVVIDSNGQPANESIIEKVYENIMSPADPQKRKAPIGALVTVTAPVEKQLDYTFDLSLKPGAEKEAVVEQFKTNLLDYYKDATAGKLIIYNKVAAILANTEGVFDFSHLYINGVQENITLADDEYPTTGQVEAES